MENYTIEAKYVVYNQVNKHFKFTRAILMTYYYYYYYYYLYLYYPLQITYLPQAQNILLKRDYISFVKY